MPPITAPPAGPLEATAPKRAKENAAIKARAVHLLTTGYPDGIRDPNVEPHPVYGPQNGQSPEDGVAAMADELSTAPRTIEHWLEPAREHGTEVLIDKRIIGGPRLASNALGRIKNTIGDKGLTELLRAIADAAQSHAEDARTADYIERRT